MDYYYHSEIPDWLKEFTEAPSLRRLMDVGMNCGCEYTHFPRFRDIGSYSRFRHSLGTALIVWHFTERKEDTLSALLHDISTPVFAHTVDFLRGDYLKQETTEEGTEERIREDRVLLSLLHKNGLSLDSVKNYHLYPIADNDSPRLSGDRLEYTLGNLENYRLASREECMTWYGNLIVDRDDASPELAFRSEALAEAFALRALSCSRIYVSDEDRYAMQILSEVLGKALRRNVLSPEDLNKTETRVISLLRNDPESREDWERFTGLNKLVPEALAPEESRRIIRAKKRWIDPLVAGKGRVSSLSSAFRTAKEAFLNESQEIPIAAE